MPTLQLPVFASADGSDPVLAAPLSTFAQTSYHSDCRDIDETYLERFGLEGQTAEQHGTSHGRHGLGCLIDWQVLQLGGATNRAWQVQLSPVAQM